MHALWKKLDDVIIDSSRPLIFLRSPAIWDFRAPWEKDHVSLSQPLISIIDLRF